MHFRVEIQFRRRAGTELSLERLDLVKQRKRQDFQRRDPNFFDARCALAGATTVSVNCFLRLHAKNLSAHHGHRPTVFLIKA